MTGYTEERRELDLMFNQFKASETAFRKQVQYEIRSALEQMDELDILNERNEYKFELPYKISGYEVTKICLDYERNEVRIEGGVCAFELDNFDVNTLKLICDELFNTFDF